MPSNKQNIDHFNKTQYLSSTDTITMRLNIAFTTLLPALTHGFYITKVVVLFTFICTIHAVVTPVTLVATMRLLP